LEGFVSFCQAVSNRSDEIKSDLQLFEAVEKFTYVFASPYE